MATAPPGTKAFLALGLLVATALAGCSVETHRPDDAPDDAPDDGDGGGPSGPETSGPSAPPEEDSGVLHVSFEAVGPTTLEVPFPTLDSCRSPEDWMGGGPTVSGAVPELRDVTGERTGRVLALVAPEAGSVSWSAQIPLGPACATLRFDPWSIDPDLENGTAEVRVADGPVSSVSVVVRQVRGGEGEATLYEGQPSTGAWTALQGRTIPV